MTPAQGSRLDRYADSHRNPVNRLCHVIGIPLIMLSLVVSVIALTFAPWLLPWAISGFVVGWVLQIAGHVVEGKPPEFLEDWRFLFVGVAWWLGEVRDWIGRRASGGR